MSFERGWPHRLPGPSNLNAASEGQMLRKRFVFVALPMSIVAQLYIAAACVGEERASRERCEVCLEKWVRLGSRHDDKRRASGTPRTFLDFRLALAELELAAVLLSAARDGQ